jgi:transcriptional regulator with XRE-family HTH domain
MKELRLLKKKSRMETAQKVNISLSYLDMIEAGTRQPSDTIKRRFAEFYNCSPLQIFLSCETTQSCTKNV